MKLLKKTTQYYFVFLILTFLIVVITFYFIAEYLIYKDVESRLQSERKYFEEYMYVNHGKWYDGCYFIDNKVVVHQVSHWSTIAVFKDTLLYDRQANAKIPFRELNFYMKLNNQAYHISIRKSIIESRIMIEYFTVIMIGMLTILFLFMYFFQQRMANRIWKPFYETLKILQELKLNSTTKIEWKDGQINEFAELNNTLNHMILKMRSDYKNLKEFTENASHELQTPISVIRVRSEELIQSEHLTDRQQYLIHDIYESFNRMSTLIQTLLLLSKIENRQFIDVIEIDVDKLITVKINEYEEFFQIKKINLSYTKHQNFICMMNPLLADILLNNLIINSIKHNIEGGFVLLNLFDDRIEISNSGERITVEPDVLFNRFIKSKSKPDSLGLGLAIVKQITDTYDLHITYTYNHPIHMICIRRINL